MGLPKIAVPEYQLTLPSTGKDIKYRPFLVKEEKLLLIAMEGQNEQEILTAVQNVISECVLEDIDANTLPMFDIEYIFLWLRAKSKGEIIDLKYTCPTCKGPIPVGFNIEDIKMHYDEKHSTKIELTNDLGVVFKYPNVALQKKISELPDDLTQIDMIFKTVFLCVDYIYDGETTYSSKDHTEKEMMDFLESLTDEQFQKLSVFYETMPKLKHELKMECKNKVKQEGKKKDKVCGYTEDLTLEGLASFFE